jgi:hypothetical protein
VDPLLEEFRRQVEALREESSVAERLTGDVLEFQGIELEELRTLLQSQPGRYFLLAAAQLNRTSLKKATAEPAAQIVMKGLRQAYAVRARLPVRVSFESTLERAVAMRSADVGRRSKGGIEQLFRERLKAEGIPLFMSPPIRTVPGVLVLRRKPDGVYPDPAAGNAPIVYLEIKNVQRVSDDIQKRLYELAEASLEMKLLYGAIRLKGLDLSTTSNVGGNSKLRARLRRQVVASKPKVVGLFLCSKTEAERYREGAETFVDRVFFQEEIEECLAYLKAQLPRSPRPRK